MLKDFDHFFLNKGEPTKGCLLALKDIILKIDDNITPSLKYGMPFFSYKEKMFCYLWTHKKTGEPYIGIVEGNKIKHPALKQEKRKRMKVLPIDPTKDLPKKMIELILNEAIDLYKNGIIKLK